MTDSGARPVLVAGPSVLGTDGTDGTDGTALVLAHLPGGRIGIAWAGVADDSIVAADVVAAVGIAGAAPSVFEPTGRVLPLVATQADDWTGRPGLSGSRLGDNGAALGTDWSAAFTVRAVTTDGAVTRVDQADDAAGLHLVTEIEALTGGALRLRHVLTNTGATPYSLEHLEVAVPVPDRVAERLDLTGRWGRERTPQRAAIGDGTWVREGRTGKPGAHATTLLVAGTAGFGFRSGEVWGVHLGWSGNSRHALDRHQSGLTTLRAGELLLPGEVVLAPAEAYATPWTYLVASGHGLDGLSEQLHAWQRSLPAHPRAPRPVTCNTWEAVYFDHDLDRLTELAQRAAEVGAERFVLDDGWFGSRRDDTSGLGDWTVSDEAWPQGLGALAQRVTALGLQFGIWFEPEMVNPDSELYRAHPDWVLATGGRVPTLFRNQLVLDLSRPEVRDHLFARIDAVLSDLPVGYVKWDHNRDLVEAGTGRRAGAPAVHEQTLGYYALLDRLRAAHPDVEWESCAAGGGRIDLGVVERVQRFWTSDMTDALSRQGIQRWTQLLIAPEYLGAHVSAPVNHQTHRAMDLDFRCATAFFGDLGIEWDLTAAPAADRERLAAWIALYREHRALLHSGRTVRVDDPSPAVRIHGVVAPDRSAAVFAHVQLDEQVADPGPLRAPGLDPAARYRATALSPDAEPAWRADGLELSGAALAAVGLPAPARRPQSASVVHLRRLDG